MPRCKVCKDKFEAKYFLQKACLRPACLAAWSKTEREVKADKVHKVKKRALKDNDRKIRAPAAQAAFNKFIRARDASLNCISCKRTDEDVKQTDGWKTGGAWDCGHFLTRGAFPELRFEELNAHKQCKSCNGGSDKYAKKTQLVRDDYRINLIEKIGLDKVLWLEGPHEPKKYTCAELKQIELTYKEKLKVI
jgi:hypothetical protein